MRPYDFDDEFIDEDLEGLFFENETSFVFEDVIGFFLEMVIFQN